MAKSVYHRTARDTAPAERAVAVTPHNTEDLAGGKTRGVYVGVSGDLEVIMAGDTAAVTFVGLAAGVVHPLSVTRIRAENTDATDIRAIY